MFSPRAHEWSNLHNEKSEVIARIGQSRQFPASIVIEPATSITPMLALISMQLQAEAQFLY